MSKKEIRYESSEYRYKPNKVTAVQYMGTKESALFCLGALGFVQLHQHSRALYILKISEEISFHAKINNNAELMGCSFLSVEAINVDGNVYMLDVLKFDYIYKDFEGYIFCENEKDFLKKFEKK